MDIEFEINDNLSWVKVFVIEVACIKFSEKFLSIKSSLNFFNLLVEQCRSFHDVIITI